MPNALFSAGLAAMTLTWALSAAAVQVGGLRCEYLEEPLGVDAAQPRLAWTLRPGERGLAQTAYQVLVADSLEALERDEGNLWDSDKTASDQSYQVVYAGKPLASRTECFWKVRVWDQRGEMSPWSPPAHWTMGLLQPEDWRGEWIGADWMQDNEGPLPWLRKEFSLAADPDTAYVYVCALGYFELYVNGRKIGEDVLSPAVSNYGKRGLYLTYDVSEYLRAGSNCIALWLGRGWHTNMLKAASQEGPLVKAQLAATPENGPTEMLATDATWKMAPSCITPLGKNTSGDYGGELYDATKEASGWNQSGFDDSAWKPAAVYHPPTPQPVAQMVEPNRLQDSIMPVGMKEYDGGYLVDMGRNYTGWFSLNLPKDIPAGAKIELSYADKQFPDGKLQTYRQRDTYVAKGGGAERFCNHFNYHAFRWALIKGLPRAPRMDEMSGRLITTGYAPAATFSCSNPLLNDIYNTVLWTYRCLSLGGYTVDCPHRERLGYGGDSGTSMEAGMMNFHLAPFYTKWAADWRDAQNEEGDVPYVAPFAQTAGGGPVWSGFCVTMPWQVYLTYNDTRVLEQGYPVMKRWLAFIDTKMKDGIMESYVGIGYENAEWSFLGDWVPPGRKQGQDRVDDRSTLFFNNCYLVHCLQLTAKIAQVLNHPEESAQYAQKAEVLANILHERFLNPGEATYVNREQTYLAMPLLFGITPEALRPQVMANLEKDIMETRQGHLNTGMHGNYYMVKYLTAQRRNDVVYAITSKDTFPSWGNMLKNGATTILEEWDGDNSQIHNTMISIGCWFVEGLGGIRPDENAPGFKHFLVNPGIIKDLTNAAATYQSPYGLITSQWTKEGESLKLTLDVPPNSTATLTLPTADAPSVTVDGRPVNGEPGITQPAFQAGLWQAEVAPGHYQFALTLPADLR